ncbi:MAG: hypothetical protein JW852_04355 [Spirochaetales bacterium]|nr:hypothetical protein [Spirochaetales bacterium]
MFKKIGLKISIIGISVAAVLLLASCFGMEMKTVFNADGSGRMTMKIRVSQMLLEMGEEGAGVDVPLSKDDLASEYEKLDGVTVVEVTEEDTAEDRIITAVIDFEDFNALSSEEDLPGEESSLETKGGRSVLKILVGPPGDEQAAEIGADAGAGETAPSDLSDMMGPPEMDESMMAMVQSFMEGYSIEYAIVAPSKILSHSHGEIGKDGRTLVYSMPMGDFIMIEEPYLLEIVW